MRMKEAIVSALQEYIDEYLFEPGKNWPKEEFNRRSYSRWAANEIMERLLREMDIRDPLDIIEEFSDEMDRCLDLSENRDIYFIFIVAKETADDIAFLFL